MKPLIFFLPAGSVILRLLAISFAKVINAYLAFLDSDLTLSSTWWPLDDNGQEWAQMNIPVKIKETFHS
jgi:hypothetical protein